MRAAIRCFKAAGELRRRGCPTLARIAWKCGEALGWLHRMTQWEASLAWA